MDTTSLQQQYTQLQQLFQQNRQTLQGMAQKLQPRIEGGDSDAREMLLDLREVAIGIQQEQQQAMNMLQMALQTLSQQDLPGAGGQARPALGPVYQAQPQRSQPPIAQGGGLLSEFMHSGIGRAIGWGAGFAIGEDIINDIF